MKALICPYSRSFEWCEEFFPGRSLCSLPVAGKTFCEYLIDCCSEWKIDRVLVADYSYSREMSRTLGKGEHWSLNLRYLGSKLYDDPLALLERHRRFFGEDEILIFWGPVLPVSADPEDWLERLRPAGNGGGVPDGVYLYRNGCLHECASGIRKTDSLKSYFDLNFMMMHNPGGYVLPGYSGENRLHRGRQVLISPGCRIQLPVLFCDHVYLGRDVQIRNGSVIGQNVLIDRGTVLDHAVILDHTFIGPDLAIRNKIVAGRRVIDPEKQVYADLEDPGLTDDMRRHGGWDFCTLTEKLLAVLLIAAGAPLFVLTVPFRPLLRGSWWEYRLGLDLYPGYWRVLSAGGRLVRHGGMNRKYVFRYAEVSALRGLCGERELEELYCSHHRNVLSMLRVMAKSLMKRIRTGMDEFRSRRTEGEINQPMRGMT